jgi:hypothetical protein
METQNEKINKICKDNELKYAIEKAKKKEMTVEEIKFYVKHDGLDYTLRVEPKGNGHYRVNCVISEDGIYIAKYTMSDHCSYGISLEFAKKLVIAFSVHHNKSK